jgi:hypothetical protein
MNVKIAYMNNGILVTTLFEGLTEDILTILIKNLAPQKIEILGV